MSYLYGDSTTSQLKSNFLEFLRDAIDFCVFVLQADAKMKRGRLSIRDLGEAAEDESERLERFINNVARAVAQSDKGDPQSPTARCGERLSALIVDAHRATIDGIRKTLADAIARIEADEAAGRESCMRALGALLAPHDPPNTSTVVTLDLGDAGRYIATLGAKADPALEWTLELAIPDGHPWSALMRVDRLMPGLEIKAPQLAGWITKEVKIRPQKIERFLVTKIVDDTRSIAVQLRNEQHLDVGFDFVIAPEGGVWESARTGTAKATRVGPADDASVGAFEPQSEDLPLLIELATKLHASLANLERRPNVSATFEGEDIRSLKDYVDLIERLVGTMTPIVREIAARSLTPNELILRRALADNRREEIFVAKKTLLDKLSVLPPELQEIFDPLGFDVAPMSERSLAAAKAKAPSSTNEPTRTELPKSVPPPPLAAPPGPPAAVAKEPPPPPPPPVVPRAAAPQASPPVVSMFAPLRGSQPPPEMGSRTLQPPHGAPPQAPQHAMPLKPPSPVPAPVVPKAAESEPPQIEVVEEDLEEEESAQLQAGHVAPPPPQAPALFGKEERPSDVALGASLGAPRNEALVSTLKKILTLSKNGRMSEAYEEYEQLFSAAAFASYRPEEQRQALKLMVLAKSHPTDSEAVRKAHRAALVRLKVLVQDSAEPADQELLGVTHLYLGDERAASAAFQAGLDVERARNPQSDLIATLMRRVSQL